MLRQRPIILGIVGDSAAGKTTITQGLVNILGADRVTHVCTDDYHKYDRGERAARGITPLCPECNYVDVIETHLECLHYGQPILKPVYDHATGALVRPEYVRPRQFVIVEGLLGFSTPIMLQFYDVKVFLDPPEDLRRVWKIKRDTTKRGYTTEQVLAELQRREGDSREFIRPQRESADIVVRFCPAEQGSLEAAAHNLNVPPGAPPDDSPSGPDLSGQQPGQSADGRAAQLGTRRGPPGRLPGDRWRRGRPARRRLGEGHLAAPPRSASGGRRSNGGVPGSQRVCATVRRWL